MKWLIPMAVSLVFAGPTLAQDRKVEQAIKHRKAAFTLMSTFFSRLLQTVEGDRPFDAKAVVNDARLVEEISRLPWEGFAAGTERGDTRAKEDIWLEEERFWQLSIDLQRKTAELSKVAATADIRRLKVAFEQTRDVCNACHKQFRKE